jgi:hypothetical protein
VAKEWTLAESYARFGCVGKNPRWSWSARSSDNQTVVLALWTDRFSRKVKPMVYREATDRPPEWTARPGNRERLENLRWAMDHCDGLFRVVMVRAKNTEADPREIEDCFPRDGLIMRVTDLNEATGTFSAVAVERGEMPKGSGC